MIHDVIIVGSGPSGVASAFGFTERGIRPLILDVGHEAPDIEPIKCNIYDYRKKYDSFDIMIGKDYEGLNHLINKRSPSPKINSPYMQFVTKDAEKLSPLEEKNLPILQSFAMGGLANAWGAGLFRCIEGDLVNLPIKAEDLSPYYDKLTDEIGISGDDDDLTRFFGSTRNLLRPLDLSDKSERMYSRYKKKKKDLNARGVFIGRPRIGLLSEKYNNRPAYDYHNLEMWYPNLPYFYTPAYTLKKLIKNDKVMYSKSVLVKRWTREEGCLKVHAQNIDDGSEAAYKCRKLILAAGTVNSSRIVLNSKKDFSSKLPFIDKSLVQIPLISPGFIGSRLDTKAFGSTHLNIIFDFKDYGLKLQGSIMELSAPARSVFYEMLPFSARDNLTFIRYFLPSLFITFLWFPADRSNCGYVMLKNDGNLEVNSPPGKVDGKIIQRVVRALTSLGVITHSLFVQPPNHSLQYAGSLPMSENPEREYQCNKYGEIYREPGVHVVDGSLFSYIPAKNFGFTLMANAMRISDHLANTIKKQ